ncbi:MAG: glycosyltransferase family 4 protein [Verrucomicrobia bacterium]|nr:glycosyltransferase family 4 protein [Verrucomicrobiota bacterium]
MQIFTLVTDTFGGHGGIAKFNRDLLTALCAAPGVTRVVALPRLLPGPPESLPEKLEFNTRGVGGKLRYAVAVLRSAIRHSRSSIIICGHINLLPLAFLARMMVQRLSSSFRPALVLVIHGIDAWQPTRSWLTNRLARQVDVVVAVSEFTRQRFWNWAPPKSARSYILPNCVDLARFTPGPKNPALQDRYGLRGRTVLLTVARLSAAERYKGIDQVLEILPVLAKEIPNLAYLIVGNGDDRFRLMEKARSLGLRVSVATEAIPSPPRTGREFADPRFAPCTPEPERGCVADQPQQLGRCCDWLSAQSRSGSWEGQGEVSNSISIRRPSGSTSPDPAAHVIFAGHIPESEKVDHYRLADAFVMPGWGEGFGIVYLEAMACGVPVLASKLDASQEAVRHGELGVLVDPKKPEELQAGIRAVLQWDRAGLVAGVEYFAHARFVSRCHHILAQI